MLVYLSIFSMLSIISIFEETFNKVFINRLYIFFLIIFFIFIGFRYEVGADWTAYKNLHLIGYKHLDDYFDIYNFFIYDYGYIFISYIGSFISKTEAIFFNLFASALFVTSLHLFIKEYNQKFITLVISFPILITIVNMGFTRQSISISLLMISILLFLKKNFIISLFILLIGFSFHKAIIIILPFYLLSIFFEKTPNLKTILLISITILFLGIIIYLSKTQMEAYFNYYFLNRINKFSLGAFYRNGIFVIPSLIFLFFIYNLSKSILERCFYFFVSLFVIFIFLYTFINSTLADRIGFYFIPFQIFLYNRVILSLNYRTNVLLFKILIIIIYFICLLAWLFFGNFSSYWIPYKLYFIS